MTYTPTKEELEELGFEQLDTKTYIIFKDEKKDSAFLYYNHPDDMPHWYRTSFHVNNIHFYPSSLDDLKTLIRILTPHD